MRAVDKTVDDPIRKRELKKHVWVGVLIGGIISIIVGGGFAVAFWVLGQDVFGNGKGIWEGCFMAVASILLTWLVRKNDPGICCMKVPAHHHIFTTLI